MRVKLTDKAQNSLREIYEYYKEKQMGKVGRNIRAKVLQKAMKLKQFPYLGQVEDQIENEEFEYRYLVESNYKIIYRVQTKDNLIFIHDIFDTRQNPSKM